MNKEEQRRRDLISLIEKAKESDSVDFKQEFYHKEKTQDLIKDTVSFANCSSCEEKYIIFGVDNNGNLFDVDYNKVRDISEINQVLKEYCEPFIDVEIYKFTYKGKKLLALIICNNMDRPYLIKKDYKNKECTFLRTGEIYIRHGATNFKANRSDLDYIYANREKIHLLLKDNLVQFKNLQHGRKKEQVCCLSLLIDNRSNKSIIIYKGSINWQYCKACTRSQIAYIEDYEERYAKELVSLDIKPLQINAYTQYKKIIFAKVSDPMIDIIKNKEIEKEKLEIVINLIDASNKEIMLDALIESIKFDLE